MSGEVLGPLVPSEKCEISKSMCITKNSTSRKEGQCAALGQRMALGVVLTPECSYHGSKPVLCTSLECLRHFDTTNPTPDTREGILCVAKCFQLLQLKVSFQHPLSHELLALRVQLLYTFLWDISVVRLDLQDPDVAGFCHHLSTRLPVFFFCFCFCLFVCFFLGAPAAKAWNCLGVWAENLLCRMPSGVLGEGLPAGPQSNRALAAYSTTPKRIATRANPGKATEAELPKLRAQILQCIQEAAHGLKDSSETYCLPSRAGDLFRVRYPFLLWPILFLLAWECLIFARSVILSWKHKACLDLAGSQLDSGRPSWCWNTLRPLGMVGKECLCFVGDEDMSVGARRRMLWFEYGFSPLKLLLRCDQLCGSGLSVVMRQLRGRWPLRGA